MARKTVEQSRHSSNYSVFPFWEFSWKRHAKRVQWVTTLTPTIPQNWPKWTLDDLWTPLGMSNLTLKTLFCELAVLFCFQIFPNSFQNSKYSVWVIPRYVRSISSSLYAKADLQMQWVLMLSNQGSLRVDVTKYWELCVRSCKIFSAGGKECLLSMESTQLCGVGLTILWKGSILIPWVPQVSFYITIPWSC